jgi:hypothetical protein
VLEAKELQFLFKLPKVLGKMQNPFYFADYILKNLESKSSSLEKKILCLNLLIILIGKYSFEFNDYYTKLFLLIQTEYLKEMGNSPNITQESFSEKAIVNSTSPPGSLFSNKYSSKFMKILEISFRSTELSFTVLASFVKVSSSLLFRF